jgi:hypothetical protein
MLRNRWQGPGWHYLALGLVAMAVGLTICIVIRGYRQKARVHKGKPLNTNPSHSADDSYRFGFPDQWAAFYKEHPKFVAGLETLAGTQKKVMKRIFVPKSLPEKLIFFSGSVVMEDFSELWLLAGNGCGVGALKILRGLYERTVTAAYLSKFPDQAQRFWNYKAVANRRLFNTAKDIYGSEQLKEVDFNQIETAYQEVVQDYQQTLCEPCKKSRVGFSWSKLSLPAMAKKAGYGLEHVYFHAYALPTQQAHSTVLAITSRVTMNSEGIFFGRDAESSFATLAASVGHVVLLRMLRVQDSFFSLGLSDEIAEREAECKDAWPGVETDYGKGL